MRILLLSLCLAMAVPGLATAQTTTVKTSRELNKLARKGKLSGSWVIAVPGVTSISLPKLQVVEGRLDLAIPGLRAVDLPALERVGSDLFVGCEAPPREQWATLGPIRPLEQAAPAEPSPFVTGPGDKGRKAGEPSDDAGPPGLVSAPLLAEVGGGLAVCSPAVTGVSAPALTEIGTDLQFYASASWSRLDLPALARVRARIFGWIDGADLTVSLPALTTVDGSTQLGGAGTLTLQADALASTAALVITGSRRTASGRSAPFPSLTLPSLALPVLERATNRLELRTLAGLQALELPALSRVDHLVLEDLPGVQAVRADLLEAIDDDLTVRGLTALGDLRMDALTRVGGDLTLQGLRGPAFTLPPVAEIGGALVLTDLRIRVLRIRGLRTAGSVRASGLGPVDLLELAALERVSGDLVLESNIGLAPSDTLPFLRPGDSTIRVFAAPKLATVAGRVRIAQAAFTAVRFDRLEQTGGDLTLVDLPVLNAARLPALREVLGRLLIGGAPALTSLGLPTLVRADALELAAMSGLQRVSAPRFGGDVRQSGGTKVKAFDLPAP